MLSNTHIQAILDEDLPDYSQLIISQNHLITSGEKTLADIDEHYREMKLQQLIEQKRQLD